MSFPLEQIKEILRQFDQQELSPSTRNLLREITFNQARAYFVLGTLTPYHIERIKMFIMQLQNSSLAMRFELLRLLHIATEPLPDLLLDFRSIKE